MDRLKKKKEENGKEKEGKTKDKAVIEVKGVNIFFYPSYFYSLLVDRYTFIQSIILTFRLPFNRHSFSSQI